ncbi:hypothetical protein [Streptomyces iconiensis]|uniref:DUF916 domain-containing protein n=1 Tax=Streptomyces iconiensis TaxID=1384038 RepID=A0ABT7A7U0_9ACTN|nr:hypothetical protein [Streptomyces iconiensis]MDJ1137393.1 hypothetical protein [Streptomyces iconiensis]
MAALAVVLAAGAPASAVPAAKDLKQSKQSKQLKPLKEPAQPAQKTQKTQTTQAKKPKSSKDEPRWSASPAPPQGEKSRDARSYFYLEGAPGAVLKDTLALTNESARARTFRLRGADAYNARGGGFAVRGKGRSEGAGKWLALAEDSVKVPPRTRAEVPFTVSVPAGAVPGDHPSAVVVSDGDRESGVRVHLRVSGPTLAALSVEKAAVRDKGDGASIAYTLVNRGNTALRPRLAVSADGGFGQLLHRAERPLPVELLPGQRVTLHEPWPNAPDLELADVRLRVTAEGGARGEATASYTAVPWAGIGTGLALLALAAGGAGWYVRKTGWYVRKRRTAARARSAPPDGEEGGDGEESEEGGDGGESGGAAAGEGPGDQDSGGQRELTGAAK